MRSEFTPRILPDSGGSPDVRPTPLERLNATRPNRRPAPLLYGFREGPDYEVGTSETAKARRGPRSRGPRCTAQHFRRNWEARTAKVVSRAFLASTPVKLSGRSLEPAECDRRSMRSL